MSEVTETTEVTEMSDEKILGQPLEKEKGGFKMSLGGYRELMDRNGVSKEILDKVDDIQTKIFKEGIMVCARSVAKDGQTCTVKVATGRGRNIRIRMNERYDYSAMKRKNDKGELVEVPAGFTIAPVQLRIEQNVVKDYYDVHAEARALVEAARFKK